MLDHGAVAASLEAFFACCPEMLFISGIDGRLLHVSAALREALGHAADPGGSLEALVHPEDRAAFAAGWARLGQADAPAQIEARLRDAQGAWLEVSCSARRAPEGDAIHGCLRRATHRPEAAAALAAAPAQPAGGADLDQGVRLKARLLDALADQMPVVVWAIDRHGIFVHHDGQAIERAGLERGQFLGKDLFALYAGLPGCERVNATLQGQRIHYTDSTHDVHWEHWMTPVLDPGGEVAYVLGVTLDISEKRRTEDELRARLAQIEQQQEVIRTLSTPIIEVWEGVLTLPMVGVVDSRRTAEVMDSLLARISQSRARFAILDLTGVDMVDTGVAEHLIQLVTAIRLLGAEGIVAGIKPSVAQTMVTLGMDLSQITTHRNLRAALGDCLRRMGGKKQPG
jgi:rsbT co-antagonist protein RsbR